MKRLQLYAFLGIALLTCLNLKAAPRQALPPYPESCLFYERFDDTNCLDGDAGASSGVTWVDSWSGYAVNIPNNNAIIWHAPQSPNPYVSHAGVIRVWFSPNWASGSRSGNQPGTIWEVESGTQPEFNLQVTPTGSGIGVSYQNQVLTGANIAWTNSSWHFICVSYNSTNTQLYLDGQLAGTGPGFVPSTPFTGITLGSLTQGAQARGSYDEFATFGQSGVINHYQSAAYMAQVYAFAAPQAALGPISAGEEAAIQQRQAERATSASLMLSEGLAQPMYQMQNSPLLDQSNLLTGPFRLVDAGFYFTNGITISNVSLVAIASGQTNLSYDVFRTPALIGPAITNSQWSWMGRGKPGQTLTFTNEPGAEGLYIGAITNSTTGNGYSDAYEMLVLNTTPSQAATIAITSPTNNASVSQPVNLTIAIALTNGVFPASMNLFLNGQSQGTQNVTQNSSGIGTGTASYALTDVAVGTYNFQAIASLWNSQTITSAVVSVKVTLPQISHLVCWLKADNQTATNNKPLLNWTDSSGYSNNASVSSSSYAPIWLTNQLNGYPIVSFNGSNQFLSLRTFLTNQGEAFIVVKPLAFNAGPLWYFSTNQSFVLFQPNIIYDNFGVGSVFEEQPLSGTLFTNYVIYAVSASSSDWNMRLNGNVIIDSPGQPINFGNNNSLGRALVSGSWQYGDVLIAEALFYNQALDEPSRQEVGRYLTTKYGFNLSPPQALTVTCTGNDPRTISLCWNSDPTVNYYSLSRQIGSGSSSILATLLPFNSQFTDSIQSLAGITYTLNAHNYAGSSTAALTTPLMVVQSPTNESTVLLNTPVSISLAPYQTGIPGWGYTFAPAKVQIYGNGQLLATETNAPWGITLTNSMPMRWNIETLSFDSAGNSRYAGILGINFIADIDSDGDGIPDGQDAWPYDPFLSGPVSTNNVDTNAPIIILTQP